MDKPSVEESCIFCRIISGRNQAKTVYEDSHVVVIEDIAPQAPNHYLVIPRKHIPTLLDLTEGDSSLLGHVYLVAGQIAEKENFARPGFRVVANCNSDGGQTVWHIHFHLLAGRPLRWPPG